MRPHCIEAHENIEKVHKRTEERIIQPSSHLPMAAPPLVFEFIGVVFTAILYGKYYYYITWFGSDHKWAPCHRSLLPDIWFILANPSQESGSMERHTRLRAHSKFHSVHGVFHYRHNPGPVRYHRESLYIYKSYIVIVQISWLPILSGIQLIFRIPRCLCWTKIHWTLLRSGWPSQIMHYIPPSTSFHKWYWWVCLTYDSFSINVFSISKWSFTDVGSCGANH